MIKLTSFALAFALVSSSCMAHTIHLYRDGGYYNSNHNYISASPQFSNILRKFSGIVSFYGHGERLNKHASDGSIFNSNKMTCAHRTLPFGTRLRVTYGNRSVIVKVTDRGPSKYTHRILDLSYGAAKVLGIEKRGTANVQVAILK